MNHRAVLLLGLLVAVSASAAAQGTSSTPQRAASGRPDLEGVWNFDSQVPLQRPPAFAGRKVMTRDESRQQQAAVRRALDTVATLVPVEAVGFGSSENVPHVEDLRTSLITHPESGRLPALMTGVRRMPGLDDLVAFLGTSKGPPPALAALLASFGGGKRESHADFPPEARCLVGMNVPFVPQLGDNYVHIIQGEDHVVLVADA